LIFLYLFQSAGLDVLLALLKALNFLRVMPDKGQSKYPSMKDIVINTKGVFKLLKDLNPHKARRPDCIPSFILKSAADELAPASF
jgi:hypothetical protein